MARRSDVADPTFLATTRLPSRPSHVGPAPCRPGERRRDRFRAHGRWRPIDAPCAGRRSGHCRRCNR